MPGSIEFPGRATLKTASGLVGLLSVIWPGLVQAQAQNLEGRKPFSGLAPDPLQSLHLSNYLIGIVIVFATLAVASWLLRRYQPQAGRGLIKVQACLSLGGKERLMVVEVQGRRLLIGVSSAGISQLQVLDSGSGETPHEHSGEPSTPPGSVYAGAGGWLQKTLKSGLGT